MDVPTMTARDYSATDSESIVIDTIPGREPSRTVCDGDTEPSIVMNTSTQKRLGRYELLEAVGKGASATVYRCRRDDGEIVALKVLAARVAANEDRLVRFYQEAQLLMRIQHPNVIEAYEVAEDNGSHYLAMEFVDGQTLGNLIECRGRLSEKAALKAVVCLARGLGAAHQLGILHRDVSLRNIMVGRDGATKLCDFEYGKEPAADLDLTIDGRGLGTPDFMSPEQFHRAKDVDNRADIYSIGVALYHMVTGRSPFPGKNYLDKWIAKSQNHYLSPRLYVPDLSKPTRNIIRRTMAARPEDRPATARDLEIIALQALQQLRRPKTAPRKPRLPVNRIVETPRRHTWSVIFLDETGKSKYFTATREQILHLIDRKQLGPDARATITGRSDYRQLADIPEFRAALKLTTMSKTIDRISNDGKSRLSQWLQALGGFMQHVAKSLSGQRRY